jgi:hypothetical protein
MNTMFKKATLGIALGAATLTAAVPAEAQRYYHRNRDNTGTAIVAGIAGLAIGAALTSGNRNDRRYDDRRYYQQRGYYPNNGYYAQPNYNQYNGYNQYDGYNRYDGYNQQYGYNRCYTRKVFDPYIGRRVRVRYCN